ncbi:RNA exonuclease 4 [Impatiens glandulifera]|uniref:RNA exonuclease 4 n=1 Tax=Impatiens glandulifera TaxID=253017 RepID=UPI001FB19A39|nr:RNA exonuclease 4 [Impatiens glandulifera]
MGSELKNPSKKPLPNPNWAQLRQKLNHGAKVVSKSVLGKRKERDTLKEDEPRPNPLIPTSSDFSVTDAVAMDCEMVGVSPLGNKSALGRVTVVNKWGNVVYDEFVRPLDQVVDFRTHISGIRPRDLRKAKQFNVVQKEVAELIIGKILVGHALRNDFKALLLSHSKKDVRDTAEYQPFLKDGRSRALRHLAAEFLGADIQNGEHCPVEDARAAMLLYQNHKKEWEKRVKDMTKLKLKQKKRKNKKKTNKE